MLPSTADTDLVYNIVDGSLHGSIDGTPVCAPAGDETGCVDPRAVSGGRAGTRTPGATSFVLANNPFATHVKKEEAGVGGPLPMARYRLHSHEDKAKPNWIRLIPFKEDRHLLGKRDGFAIHGRGPRGSDGCIVPLDPKVLEQLLKLVKAREAAKKPAPTLRVVAIGDLGYYERFNAIA